MNQIWEIMKSPSFWIFIVVVIFLLLFNRPIKTLLTKVKKIETKVNSDGIDGRITLSRDQADKKSLRIDNAELEKSHIEGVSGNVEIKNLKATNSTIKNIKG